MVFLRYDRAPDLAGPVRMASDAIRCLHVHSIVALRAVILAVAGDCTAPTVLRNFDAEGRAAVAPA